MIIVRERNPYKEPFNARGKCECGCEMELPNVAVKPLALAMGI